jgi:uncharacterized protein YraI
MFNKAFGAFIIVSGLLAPAAAMAASTAVATTNVNLRAGPSTQYPVVNVVGSGDDVRVYGCLSNRSWCDVGYAGQRGWMSSNYLAYVEAGRRYTGTTVVTRIGVPVIGFSFGSYWDNHYKGRSFYHDRNRWDRGDRRDVQRARKEVKQERHDVKDARQELRQERRTDGDVRGARQELRHERAERKDAKRQLRRERRD